MGQKKGNLGLNGKLQDHGGDSGTRERKSPQKKKEMGGVCTGSRRGG